MGQTAPRVVAPGALRGAAAMPGSAIITVQFKPSDAVLQAGPFCTATAVHMPQSLLKTPRLGHLGQR
jgi:hypothetical protein